MGETRTMTRRDTDKQLAERRAPASGRGSSTRRSSGHARLLCGALALAACGQTTALELTFVPNPNITDPEALVSSLSAVRLIFDAAQGLYPLSSAREVPPLEIADVDNDGAAELVVDVDVGEHLPLVRVEPGALAPETIDVRAEGHSPEGASGEPIALGAVSGASFTVDQTTDVEVPFNIRPKYRAPRVTQVLPEDGAKDLFPAAINSVMVIFSKRINPDSLVGRDKKVLQVLSVGAGGEETLVAPKNILVRNLGSGDTAPTTAEYVFASALDEGMYRVRVAVEATDLSGRPLDQVAIQSGNQPFSSSFAVGLGVSTAHTCAPEIPCEENWCDSGGTRCFGGATCVDGACVPASCPASCSEGTVCDANLAVCVVDCRLAGEIGGCDDGLSCGANGVCQAP